MNDSSQGARDKRKFTARLKEARIGDPAAQYDVALMYATGVGVAKSVAQAFTWTKTAAEKGYVPAQFLLGSAYLGGLGVPKDEQKALIWFLRSHEHGNEKASLKLARLLAVAQPASAFQFAMEAAEKGLAEAQCMVAECLAMGTGVAADVDQSLHWYERAAELGSAAAQFALGRWCESQDSELDDQSRAAQWYRRAAKAGHPGAQWALDSLDLSGLGRAADGKGRTGGRERRAPESRLVKYAGGGRAEDAYHLGLIYELGHSVERNAKQARAWLKKAAEQGDARAQFALANSLEQADSVQAGNWLRRAAEQGHTQAQVALGEWLLQGVERDALGALSWFARAAEQGDAQAEWALVRVIREHGQDLVSSNTARAASGGNAEAQCAMGDRYRLGQGVAQNWFDACRWYQMAAEQGHAQAQCTLAGCYAEGKGVKKDLAHAFAWYEKAAAQNLPRAQWNLGELYATGLPGVVADAKKATMLCKRAANAGFVPAQATLATLFARAKKHDRAVPWWTQAADQGDLESQFNLAQSYRLGLGVDKDEAKAFSWLLKAAEGGLAAAQSRLGLAYATGEGAALDPVEATKWFELAALAGDTAAAANWAHAKRTTGPAQQAEADRRAQAWLRSREIKT
jgi:TPR repeat protein